jgi:hypothetical protein
MLNRQHCLRLCTIAAISGALFSAQAIAAEQWVKVLTNDRGVWFVDKSSIDLFKNKRTTLAKEFQS